MLQTLECVTNIIEGQTVANKERKRPRKKYIDQLKERVEVTIKRKQTTISRKMEKAMSIQHFNYTMMKLCGSKQNLKTF